MTAVAPHPVRVADGTAYFLGVPTGSPEGTVPTELAVGWEVNGGAGMERTSDGGCRYHCDHFAALGWTVVDPPLPKESPVEYPEVP